MTLALFVITLSIAPITSAQENDYAPKSNLSLVRFDEPPLVILGSKHTYEINDAQVKDIERIYRMFKPTLVLVEGGVWENTKSREAAITCCGEMGFLQHLAYIDGVRYGTWEGKDRDETKRVLTEFTAEDLKVFHALRIAPQFLRDEKNSTEMMNNFLKAGGTLDAANGLTAGPSSVEELEATLGQQFGTLFSWRHLKTAADFDTLLESPEFSRFKRIKTAINQYRDESAVHNISAALEKKERVLVLCGNLHFRYIMEKMMQL